MRKFILLLSFITTALSLFAQTKVSGIVKDGYTGETLPGATVLYAEGKGTTTDLDGKFSMEVPNGTYTVSVKFVGFSDFTYSLKATGKPVYIEAILQSADLKEVEIIADIAVDRKTPVAFSDVSALKIREELGTQDLPLILNTTPGVYATQSGGGDGDARINIRGFNQRFVAVMVDGIPMNDMENGWVYWSNWFGLDNVTQKVQVQRGLGATKLSIPAIGGSINVLSQGIDQKRSIVLASEVGNNGNYRQSIGFNSGRLKGDWGITAAFSYRANDGWVTNLGSEQFFYFIKVQKEFKKHSFSLSAMGSPQEHFQRLGRQPMRTYDVDFARANGDDGTIVDGMIVDKGLRYNSEWGYLRRDRYDANAEEEIFNSRKNYYHKPIANFKHFWTPNDKIAVSNILYASFGDGGGTRLNNTEFNEDGQLDAQFMYDRNTKVIPPALPFLPPTYPYNLTAVNDQSQFQSKYYLQSSINSHRWYGLLSTVKYKLSNRLEFSAGIDGRYYTVRRYQEVYDLMGGDYVYIPDVLFRDQNNLSKVIFRQGDKINYDINTVVLQYGGFGLAEYDSERWSAFVNLTVSENRYNRTSYFLPKKENGDYQDSGWLQYLGYTGKGGFKYKVNKRHSAFVNAGYLNRAQMVQYVYSGTSINVNRGTENEEISSAEAGYIINNPNLRFAGNIYYTYWVNRPLTVSVSDGTENFSVFVPGLRAEHKGIELETEYKIQDKLSIEGVVSIGDWRWDAAPTAFILDEIGLNVLDTVSFDAKGVKVGDAAQTQFSLGLRYAPIKGLYIKPRITYFDQNYSDFNPEALVGDNRGRQSWRMPSYYTIDLNMGYSRPVAKKYRMGVKLNLMNITNERFITDATNGQTFDGETAQVFFGMGFRWNVGVNFNF